MSVAVSVIWSALMPVAAMPGLLSPSIAARTVTAIRFCVYTPEPVAAMPTPAAAPIATEPANTSALIFWPAIAVTDRLPPAPIVEFRT